MNNTETALLPVGALNNIRSKFEAWLSQALTREATDLHLRANSVPAQRIFTQLSLIAGAAKLTANDVDDCFDFCMEMCMNDTAAIKKHLAQHGWADFNFRLKTPTGDVVARGNSYKQSGAPALALRFFHKRHVDLKFQGMEHLAQFLQWDTGLIVLTGATGSGKTTVAGALIEHLNATDTLHIATIEDPIEYPLVEKRSVITQRTIPGDVTNFEDGIKSLLRQDPDVIFIGEVRDREVMRQLLNASETGHLVITTMHAGSVAEAFSRIVGMFPSEEQERIRTTLAGLPMAVVNQALIPPARGKPPVLVHELFLTKGVEAAYSTIRDGQWVQLQNLQMVDARMRHWDREIAKLVRAGKLPRDIAQAHARDIVSFQKFLS
jgi:twitching motility protein PilT